MVCGQRYPNYVRVPENLEAPKNSYAQAHGIKPMEWGYGNMNTIAKGILKEC